MHYHKGIRVGQLQGIIINKGRAAPGHYHRGNRAWQFQGIIIRVLG